MGNIEIICVRCNFLKGAETVQYLLDTLRDNRRARRYLYYNPRDKIGHD